MLLTICVFSDFRRISAGMKNIEDKNIFGSHFIYNFITSNHFESKTAWFIF